MKIKLLIILFLLSSCKHHQYVLFIGENLFDDISYLQKNIPYTNTSFLFQEIKIQSLYKLIKNDTYNLNKKDNLQENLKKSSKIIIFLPNKEINQNINIDKEVLRYYYVNLINELKEYNKTIDVTSYYPYRSINNEKIKEINNLINSLSIGVNYIDIYALKDYLNEENELTIQGKKYLISIFKV